MPYSQPLRIVFYRVYEESIHVVTQRNEISDTIGLVPY
jgi:hypothetical protein